MNDIAVIGGGISGLTVGHLLRKKEIKAIVFERTHRAGGYMGSKSDAGFLIEYGPNSFLNNEPKTLQLISELGLEKDLIRAKDESKSRHIYVKGKLQPVPMSPKDLIKSQLFSLGTKFKIFKEYQFPPEIEASPDSRSLYDFAKDHFGEDIAETVFRPMIVGIWGGDAKKLSLNKTFPRFVDFEKEHKSLIRAMKAQAEKAAEPTTSMNFKGGLQTLVDSLSKQLGEHLRLNCYVTGIERKKNGFVVQYKDEVDNETFSEEFKDVILCLPPQAMSEMLEGVLDEITLEKLKEFPTAPIKTLSVAFTAPLNFSGFGTLVSPEEDVKILGFLHPKDIFEGRCPPQKDLVTIMMGGTFHPQAVNWSLQNGVKIAMESLEKMIGPLPPVEKYWAWNHLPGIPQYNTDWVSFMKLFEDQITATQGLHLNATVVGGVAINDCIRKSYELADRFNPEDYKWKRPVEAEETELFGEDDGL